MRVQCDVCEKALAQVLCCADEAALCMDCDAAVHAANKLANKHQRIAVLQGEAHLAMERPLCDICQEKSGFFFCMEDRAVLCRDCDIAIHLPNTLSAQHRRFLFTNTRVSLEAMSDPADSGEGASSSLQANGVTSVPEPVKAIAKGGQGGSGAQGGSGGSGPRKPLPAKQQGLKGKNGESSGAGMGEGSSRTSGLNGTKLKGMEGMNGLSGAGKAGSQSLWGLPNGGGYGGLSAGLQTAASALEPSDLDNYPGSSGIPSPGGLGGMGGDALGAHTLAFARASLGGGTSIGMGSSRGRAENAFEVDNVPGWRVDELLNIPELADGYSLADIGSSKAEMGNLGDFDWTADLSLFDEQVYAESLHEVPSLSSPGGGGLGGPSGLAGGHSLASLAGGVGGSGGGGGAGGMRSSAAAGGGSSSRRAAAVDLDDSFVVPDLSAPSKRRKAVA